MIRAKARTKPNLQMSLVQEEHISSCIMMLIIIPKLHPINNAGWLIACKISSRNSIRWSNQSLITMTKSNRVLQGIRNRMMVNHKVTKSRNNPQKILIEQSKIKKDYHVLKGLISKLWLSSNFKWLISRKKNFNLKLKEVYSICKSY